MRIRNIVFGSFMCVLGAGAVPAAVPAADLKIGYVNAVKVIEEAPQGEAALKKLEAEFAPRDKQIVEMQNKLKQLEQDLEKNALVLKDADHRSREFEIVSLKRDLRRATQEFREDYNLRRNEELAALQKIVQKTIAEIAKQENYDLVLESAVYASTRADITDKILKRLGKK
ncbi:membrane protein [Sulfuricaulis limicola]|uniref:Membrane protein n=2 Tax=Sulfuricaulis limicola TaxID=1620215 RepID=A0A1B4XGJ8_9GAMM|nr:membrane protein [Sulfuricaulis limicola]